MPYVCQVTSSYVLYFENEDQQTRVTIRQGQPGQQQQSSCCFDTGIWSSIPELYRFSEGFLLQIQASLGSYSIHIQGSSMTVMTQVPSLEHAFLEPIYPVQQVPTTSQSSLPSMQPMQPMQPMRMDSMQMSASPMEMRMGDMEMRMGSAPKSRSATRRFCSQCGEAVKSEDRFCSSCGHALN